MSDFLLNIAAIVVTFHIVVGCIVAARETLTRMEKNDGQ